MQADLKLVATWAGHTGPVLAVGFHPSGTSLASCGTDSTVCLWTLEAVEPPHLLLGPTPATWLFSVAFHPKLALVASISGTGQLWWWDLATRQLAAIWGGHDAEGLALAFSHDGRLLATGSADGLAVIRESIGGTVLQRLPHPDTVCSLAWSPDDHYLLTGAQDGQARVWQVASGQLQRRVLQAEGWVNAVAWSPDGRRVACGLETEQAVLVDLPASQATRVLEGHIGSISTVAFSPDGQVFATGSADGTMRLWDVTTGRFLLASGDHQQAVTGVAFPPRAGPAGQRWLATASRDRLVRLWSLAVSS